MKELKVRLLGFLSRKFLLALGGIVFYLLGGFLGKFDWSVVSDALKLIVLGYIGVEGLGDAVARRRF